jgi:hypothetical protein
MSTRACKNCDKPIASPNLGRGKWQRWCNDDCKASAKARQQVDAETRQLTWPECTVDGCGLKVRSGRAQYCEKHYGRLRRNGHLTRLVPEYREFRGVCIVDGCLSMDQGPAGLCARHLARQRRHGDPLVRLATGAPAGPDHPSFKGDEITYSAAHMRTRGWRGPAADHDCIDCGRRAEHWSYDHADPNELVEQTSKAPLMYSADPEHYQPRCAQCHKNFDLGRELVTIR